MELSLVRTEYNMKFGKHTAKSILACREGKGEVYVFVDGAMAYYYPIESVRELAMSEIELSLVVTEKMFNDRKRWIRDLTVIEDNKENFKFVNKEAVYSCTVGNKEILLRLSTSDVNDKQKNFKVSYTNEKTGDNVCFEIRASDHEDLLRRVAVIAQSVVAIAGEFTQRSDELLESTFARAE